MRWLNIMVELLSYIQRTSSISIQITYCVFDNTIDSQLNTDINAFLVGVTLL